MVKECYVLADKADDVLFNKLNVSAGRGRRPPHPKPPLPSLRRGLPDAAVKGGCICCRVGCTRWGVGWQWVATPRPPLPLPPAPAAHTPGGPIPPSRLFKLALNSPPPPRAPAW